MLCWCLYKIYNMTYFNVLLDNISLILRHLNCLLKALQIRSILGTCILSSGRDVSRATHARFYDKQGIRQDMTRINTTYRVCQFIYFYVKIKCGWSDCIIIVHAICLIFLVSCFFWTSNVVIVWIFVLCFDK